MKKILFLSLFSLALMACEPSVAPEEAVEPHSETETEVAQMETDVQPSSMTEIEPENEAGEVVENGSAESEFPKSPPENKPGFVSCIDSLFFYSKEKIEAGEYEEGESDYTLWKERFAELYPELDVYDAGAYCELEGGQKLISFSYFDPSIESDKPLDQGGQMIILFDENDNKLKATEGFYCPTLGDLGYPTLESLEEGMVTMSCNSGDAGQIVKKMYQLKLESFEYEELEG